MLEIEPLVNYFSRMSSQISNATNLKIVPSGAASEPIIEEIDDDICPKCFGSGMEIVEGKGAKLCSCRQSKGKIEDLYKVARIPEHYLPKDFTNFRTFDLQTGAANEYLERAKDKALDFVKNYPKVNQGIIFSGPVGVGKTHLATAIIKGLIDRNFTNCLFYEFFWLLKEIQDSYNQNTKTSELQLLNRILSVDILVLDEIGSSKPTDWVRDTLMNIINTRYNTQKITIFTTNYLDEEIRSAQIDREYVKEQILKREGTPNNLETLRRSFETYTFQEWEKLIQKEKRALQVSDESLTERIGYRLRSRIYQMCEEVYISGRDFRQQFRKKSAFKK